MPTLRRRLGLAALFATLALFLAGCMRMDMALTLNEDDTFDGSVVMAFSDELAESANQLIGCSQPRRHRERHAQDQHGRRECAGDEPAVPAA